MSLDFLNAKTENLGNIYIVETQIQKINGK